MRAYKKDELRVKNAHRIVILPDACFAILFTFITTAIIFFGVYSYLKSYILLLSVLIIALCMDIIWLILHIGLKLKKSNTIVYKLEERKYRVVKQLDENDEVALQDLLATEDSLEAVPLYVENMTQNSEAVNPLALPEVESPKTINEQVSSMNKYFLSNGYQTSFAQSFISQLFFSKMIVVKGNESERAVELVSSMLDAKEIALPKEVDEDFITFLLTAKANPKRIFFINLKGYASNELDEALSPFISYLSNPSNKSTVTLGNKIIPITPNVFFLYNVSSILDLLNIKSDLNKYLGIIDFTFFKKPFAVSELTPVGMNLNALTMDMNNLKNTVMFEEENWKKIDVISALVKQACGYTMPNKVSIRLENYLATYQSLIDDASRIIDEILPSSLLLPGLSNLTSENISNANKIIEALKEDFSGDMNRSTSTVKACINALNKKED